MRTSRRGFLRALGLGAAATAVDHRAIIGDLRPVSTATPAASGRLETNELTVRTEHYDGVHKVGAWVPVTREVLEDGALDVQGYVDREAARHLAARLGAGPR